MWKRLWRFVPKTSGPRSLVRAKEVRRNGSTLNGAENEPILPTYVARSRENLAERRARLLYQSRKRGMLENGLLLSTFFAKFSESLTEDELLLYDMLINEPGNDWEIYAWAVGSKPVPPRYDNVVMRMLQNHARNDKREERIRQPELNL